MRSVILRVAGATIAVSAAAHAAAWSTMRVALSLDGVPAALAGSLAAGWLFGSGAMALFGVLVFRAGARLARGDASGLWEARAVAVLYVGFGVAAYLVRELNPQFLGFVALGLLAGLPTLGFSADGTGRR